MKKLLLIAAIFAATFHTTIGVAQTPNSSNSMNESVSNPPETSSAPSVPTPSTTAPPSSSIDTKNYSEPSTSPSFSTPDNSSNNISRPTNNHSTHSQQETTSFESENSSTTNRFFNITSHALGMRYPIIYERQTTLRQQQNNTTEKPSYEEALKKLVIMNDAGTANIQTLSMQKKYVIKAGVATQRSHVYDMQSLSIFLADEDFKQVQPLLKTLYKELNELTEDRNQYEEMPNIGRKIGKITLAYMELDKVLMSLF